MDKAATNSETWDSVPVLSGGTAIIRQRCRQALGDFFRAFVKDDPWWVSLSIYKEYLYYVLLFKAKVTKSQFASHYLIL
jgi:hypothetical protein